MSSIFDFIKQSFGKSDSEIHDIKSQVVDASSAEGILQTTDETPLIAAAEKEAFRRLINRRRLFGAASHLAAFALGTGFDIGKEAAGHHLSEKITEYNADNEPFEFNDAFLAAFYQNRGSKDIDTNLPQSSGAIERRFVALFVDLRDGQYITSAEEEELKSLFLRANGVRSKLVLADVLSTQYIRAGEGNKARDLFNSISTTKIEHADDRRSLAEKIFSMAYTSVPRDHALSPDLWGFDAAFACLDKDELASLGIHISNTFGKTAVNIPGSLGNIGASNYFNAKGFYIVNWTLLYWSICQNGADLASAAEIQYDSLALYSADGNMARQIWNFAFIIGLQYHRLGLSSGNSWGEFEIRDKFFQICFSGIKEGKNPGAIVKQSKRIKELLPNEVVPYCMAMLLRSDEKLSRKKYMKGVAPASQIAGLRESIRPLALHLVGDQFRFPSNPKITEDEAGETYSVGRGYLEIYTQPAVSVRKFMLSRGNL